MPGVVTYIDHNDIPGKKVFKKDEQVFAINKVTCYGQVIGAIVADTKEVARQAAREVHVQYEDLKPILTVQVQTSHHYMM